MSEAAPGDARPAAPAIPAPPEAPAIPAPPGPERPAPPGPERAIGLISELKANAALFAAFAFGALNLPGTLILSESRVTSASSSISTSRPVPDSDLLKAFVVLDATTLGCMLVCVVVSQLLLYRLADGSYEAGARDATMSLPRCAPVH